MGEIARCEAEPHGPRWNQQLAGVTLMRISTNQNVRFSERRASIGFIILMAVSLGLLGAQTALGTAPSDSGSAIVGGPGGGS